MNTEQNEARNYLLSVLNPGSTVYTVITHVARSGMSRSIQTLIAKDSEIVDITWAVARVTGYTFDRKNGGVKIGGCGMDMAFEVVYNLGYKLWPNGTDKPHSVRNGEPDTDGGYALNKRSL